MFDISEIKWEKLKVNLDGKTREIFYFVLWDDVEFSWNDEKKRIVKYIIKDKPEEGNFFNLGGFFVSGVYNKNDLGEEGFDINIFNLKKEDRGGFIAGIILNNPKDLALKLLSVIFVQIDMERNSELYKK